MIRGGFFFFRSVGTAFCSGYLHIVSMTLILMLLLLCCQGLQGAPAADQSKEKSMVDRIMQFYSWNDPKAPKTTFQGKQFMTKGAFTDKKFNAGEYAGVKNYGSKDFATKSFSESGKSWFGKLFASKKLPENLQEGNRDASKNFETGNFKTKDFDSAKKADPYAGRGSFETKEITFKGKTQGAIDNDQKLQESIRKGLSIDDVKRLLNKPGSPSE